MTGERRSLADLSDTQLSDIANDLTLLERDRRPAREELAHRKATAKPTPIRLNGTATLPEPVIEVELPDPAPWPDPINPAAYHGLAGDYVRLLEPETESDPVAILLQTLVMFGNLVGRGAWYTVEDTRHHVNEFALLVGDTAKGRKGTSEGRVRHLLHSVDMEWEGIRVRSGLSSGEGLIDNVRDPIVKTEHIKHPKAGESAYQETEIPGVLDKRLMVIESEFASILRVLARDTNTLGAILRLAWDGKILSTMTKNSPATATGAHISMIGHITRDELLAQIKEMGISNGFANRILFAAVRRSRYLPEGGGSVDVGDIVNRLRKAVEYARKAGEIRRSSQAREAWAYIYPELSDASAGAFGNATSRGEAHVLRLSMLYALLDCTSTIEVDHLLAALALWDYCRASAKWVFGASVGETDADTLISALKQAPDGLDRSAIARVFDGHKPKRELDITLAKLAASGMATCERVRGSGTKPREVWRSNSANTPNTQPLTLYEKTRSYIPSNNIYHTLSQCKSGLEEREVDVVPVSSAYCVFSEVLSTSRCSAPNCPNAAGDGLDGLCPNHWATKGATV